MEWVNNCNKKSKVIEIIDNPPIFDKFRCNNLFIMEEFIKATIDPNNMYLLNVV